MKTLFALTITFLATLSSFAQDYKDGELFKINDSLTLKCIIFQGIHSSTINIVSTSAFEYPFDSSIENTLVQMKDRSILKRAFQETFTPEELERYKDVEMSIIITHNGTLKPVDAMFSIGNKEPDNAISPFKFATLRQKLIDYAEFETKLKLNPDLYYTWNENIVVPLSYYLQSK